MSLNFKPFQCGWIVCLLTLSLLQTVSMGQSFDPPAGHAAYVDPVNGSDILAQGTPGSPYKTMGKGMQAAWQQVHVNVKAAEETLELLDASVQWALGAASLPLTTGTAAMVVDQDSLLALYPDALIFLRLESLGLDVTLVTDNRVPVNQFTAEMAEEYDLLVITESASSGNVQPLANVNMPVINMRGSAWPGWNMSADPGPSQSVGTQLTITDAGSPLAAGLSGTVTIYNAPWLLNHTTAASLPAGANTVATLAGDPNQVCLFTIDAGATMTGGGAAPGRRVGFFLFGRPRTVDSVNYTFMDRNAAIRPEVIIAEGDVPVESTLRMTSEMQLRAGWNSTFDEQDPLNYVTTMDGRGELHMVEFSGAGSRFTLLEGFHLINGFHDNPDRGGGAVYADGGGLSDATIRKCIFLNNHATFQGGAFYAVENDAQLVLEDCIFTGNTSPNGLAISTRNGPELTIERCLFTGNVDPTGGRSVIYFANGATRSTRIINCVFTNNETGGSNSRIVELNGGETDDRRHFIYHNTFYNNRATGEVIYDLDNAGGTQLSRMNIYNNLFVNNVCTGVEAAPIFQRFIEDPSGTTTNIGGNMVFGNVNYNVSNPTGNAPLIQVGVNAIAGNPQFLDAGSGDLRLAQGSAAIDAGLSLPEVVSDYLGVVRPQGSGFDIGAYEFDGALAPNNAGNHWMLY